MPSFHYLPKDKGSFILEENDARIAEMVVDISDGIISVYHTGVEDQVQGRGIGTQLVTEMAQYARLNSLKVIPHCPFVKSVFRRREQEYADVWLKVKP